MINFSLPGSYSYYKNEKIPAGFLSGIFHGFLIPLELLLSMFTFRVRIYETLNNGFLYDLGYFIGILALFSMDKI